MTGRGNEIPVKGSDGRRRAVNLLLLLSRMDFSAEQKRLIAEEIRLFDEWKQFAGLAVRHGVAALIWQNLSDLGHAGEVPKAERNILEGLRFKSIARVSWITEAAARVTALLEREGIKVVLLKGLALEHTVYGSKGLRQMSDADLLVAPADALRARDILIRDGFRSMSLKSPLYRHIILDLGNHLPELHRGGISVDLHYRLFGPEGEEMVERAIRDSVIITGVDREPGRTAAVTRESEDGVGVSSGTDAAVNSGTGTPGAVASSLALGGG
ncbi:MAG: nucleotidyltransferase family protein [Bacteroidales bacterium]|nr:nucleotidyltransferase family protein [Bacteroidales bacterium]